MDCIEAARLARSARTVIAERQHDADEEAQPGEPADRPDERAGADQRRRRRRRRAPAATSAPRSSQIIRRSGAGESLGVTRYQWPSSMAAVTDPSASAARISCAGEERRAQRCRRRPPGRRAPSDARPPRRRRARPLRGSLGDGCAPGRRRPGRPTPTPARGAASGRARRPRRRRQVQLGEERGSRRRWPARAAMNSR